MFKELKETTLREIELWRQYLSTTDSEKAFDKTEQPFAIKTLNRLKLERTLHNPVRGASMKNPTASTMFHDRRLKASAP